ncbi:PIG-L family deacetylase [Streptomyces sp. NPDC050263]|uniref:PIG-L family deacetylase n=1 Tax=Streptomyces sp. NPDC050263 TaxID=3155037 RepID=UPI0034160F53
MTTPTDPVPATPTGRPWIWYEPHQDDLALWFPKGAAHHALAGRDTHLVSATDGSTSVIRAALNGEADNGWWGGYHYPAREGIPAPLSPDDFAAGRDRELLHAAPQLGIRRANVHLELGTRGAAITVAQAEALIRRYEDLYPGAGHYTMHWLDTDPTHAALGQALRNLALSEPGTFADCRWVVRTSQAATIPGAVEYVVPAALQAQAFHMARSSAKCFGAWAPEQGMYAIGQHSVPADFAAVGAGRSEWIVKTP